MTLALSAAAEREFVQGTIEKLNYIDSGYDTVFSFGSILANFRVIAPHSFDSVLANFQLFASSILVHV